MSCSCKSEILGCLILLLLCLPTLVRGAGLSYIGELVIDQTWAWGARWPEVFLRGSLHLLPVAQGGAVDLARPPVNFCLWAPGGTLNSTLDAGRAGLWLQTLRGDCFLYCTVDTGRQDSSLVPIFSW